VSISTKTGPLQLHWATFKWLGHCDQASSWSIATRQLVGALRLVHSGKGAFQPYPSLTLVSQAWTRGPELDVFLT